MSNCILRNANLRNVNLTNANLKGADLQGANLQGACLKGANMVNVQVKDAVLDLTREVIRYPALQRRLRASCRWRPGNP